MTTSTTTTFEAKDKNTSFDVSYFFSVSNKTQSNWRLGISQNFDLRLYVVIVVTFSQDKFKNSLPMDTR